MSAKEIGHERETNQQLNSWRAVGWDWRGKSFPRKKGVKTEKSHGGRSMI